MKVLMMKDLMKVLMKVLMMNDLMMKQKSFQMKKKQH
jgi:hypothetical protein